jgi:hypothetical protein
MSQEEAELARGRAIMDSYYKRKQQDAQAKSNQNLTISSHISTNPPRLPSQPPDPQALRRQHEEAGKAHAASQKSSVHDYAAARAAQEHSRKLESWPQGPNGVPMPPAHTTGVYPAGRPQYPNGIPNIGHPQAPNGTPIIPPRFGMKLGG